MSKLPAGLEGIKLREIISQDVSPENFERWQDLRMAHYSDVLTRSGPEVAAFVGRTTLESVRDRNTLVGGTLNRGQRFARQRLLIAERDGEWVAGCKYSDNTSSDYLRKPRPGLRKALDIAWGWGLVQAKMGIPHPRLLSARYLLLDEVVRRPDQADDLAPILVGAVMSQRHGDQAVAAYPFDEEEYFKSLLKSVGTKPDGTLTPVPDAFGPGTMASREHWTALRVDVALHEPVFDQASIARGIEHVLDNVRKYP